MTQATTAADISANGADATPADVPTDANVIVAPADADKDAMQGGPAFPETDVPMQRLFHCLDSGYSLHTFLNRFPQVSAEQALDAIGKRMRANDVVRSDRGVLGGTPTFVGARVPVEALFSHLARGADIDEFLEDFPTVSREQAVNALALAQTALDAIAYETSDR